VARATNALHEPNHIARRVDKHNSIHTAEVDP
jgi:hypothetical protein